MDSPIWYLILLVGFITTLVVISFISHHVPDLSSAFSRNVRIPLLIRRRKWDSVTRLDAILLFVCLLANVVLIFIPFHPFDWRKIEKRCALIAAVNILPLCVGMRMGPVKVLNIHRTLYRLFHHWIGRMAILEALCHTTIVLLKKPRPGALVYTGYGVSVQLSKVPISLIKTGLRQLASVHASLVYMAPGITRSLVYFDA